MVLTNSSQNVEIGIQVVPQPIIQHIQRCIKDRPNLPHVYHVTDLIPCLRKEFYKRKNPGKNEFTSESAFNMYRGKTFDNMWSPLFEQNQESCLIQRDGITITGTFDFINEENNEKILYDLKMPSSVHFKKQNGAGSFYKMQVQAYLAMLHQNGKYLDVTKAKVLMIAEDFVTETVEADDETILKHLWKRAFALDAALNKESPKTLRGPEENWECNPKYCSFNEECKNEKI